MSEATAEPKDAAFPRPLPDEPGFYWALMIWEFAVEGEYRTIVSYIILGGEPILTANQFQRTPWQYTKPVIPHDILEWGPRLEFPKI